MAQAPGLGSVLAEAQQQAFQAVVYNPKAEEGEEAKDADVITAASLQRFFDRFGLEHTGEDLALVLAELSGGASDQQASLAQFAARLEQHLSKAPKEGAPPAANDAEKAGVFDEAFELMLQWKPEPAAPAAGAPADEGPVAEGWKDDFKPLAEIICTKLGKKFLVRKAKSDLPLLCKSELGAGINKGFMPADCDPDVAAEFVNVFLKAWIDATFGNIKKCKMGPVRKMLAATMAAAERSAAADAQEDEEEEALLTAAHVRGTLAKLNAAVSEADAAAMAAACNTKLEFIKTLSLASANVPAGAGVVAAPLAPPTDPPGGSAPEPPPPKDTGNTPPLPSHPPPPSGKPPTDEVHVVM